ncbi:MAG: cytidine deaminase, partial [Candidatus Nanoarchaeia archaeon]|nr:cytidine deaminase [Candidatus Nanoarchaeia archaeon]
MKSDKRTNYISWSEYFMGIAMLSSMRSKDPNTQVGACIIDESNKI